MLCLALWIISKPSVNSNLSYSPETLNSGQNRRFFVPCDPEIWQITLKNNRAPLLYCFKLCASFHSHQWILTGVTVRKRPIWVKIDVFLSCVTLKFAGWSWKTIGNLFYVASSFVHHLKAIGKLKLKSQSGNAQSGSKSAIFLSCVTFKFDGWPWKTIGHPFLCCFKLCASFHSHQWITNELQSGNAQFGSKSTIEIWQMTLINNRAPLLCYFRLCASFRSYWSIQTGVTVRKCPIWVKINDFF